MPIRPSSPGIRCLRQVFRGELPLSSGRRSGSSPRSFPPSLPKFREVVRDLRPIDGVPPRLDVLGASVLILQVIGVLPDVDAEERLAAIQDGIVLVRGRFDGELAATDQQPRPPGPESRCRGLGECFFEIPEAAERIFDGVGQIPRRLPAAALFHDLPEHGMIQMAAAVVAHGGTYGLRHFADPCEQILDRKLLKLRMAFESLIEIVDIRPVVLVVVNLHRLRVDVRLERVEGVWERRQIVRHRTDLLSSRLVTGVIFTIRCVENTASFPPREFLVRRKLQVRSSQMISRSAGVGPRRGSRRRASPRLRSAAGRPASQRHLPSLAWSPASEAITEKGRPRNSASGPEVVMAPQAGQIWALGGEDFDINATAKLRALSEKEASRQLQP